jgi:hypothetical protein
MDDIPLVVSDPDDGLGQRPDNGAAGGRTLAIAGRGAGLTGCLAR